MAESAELIILGAGRGGYPWIVVITLRVMVGSSQLTITRSVMTTEK